jgi:TetR/AcrR family transcriptional repressor of nem operon
MRRRLTRRATEPTRDWIVARAAVLLRTRGYLSTPLSEIMQATGLQKGGIYHHFDSRDALALAAFQCGARQVGEGLLARLEGKTSARRKLLIMVRYPLETYWRGGCPVGNLAIEADDSSAKFTTAARSAMNWLIQLFVDVIEQGVKAGELVKGDAKARATRMVAALEGGILLANLYKDARYLETVVESLEREVRAGLA